MGEKVDEGRASDQESFQFWGWVQESEAQVSKSGSALTHLSLWFSLKPGVLVECSKMGLTSPRKNQHFLYFPLDRGLVLSCKTGKERWKHLRSSCRAEIGIYWVNRDKHWYNAIEIGGDLSLEPCRESFFWMQFWFFFFTLTPVTSCSKNKNSLCLKPPLRSETVFNSSLPSASLFLQLWSWENSKARCSEMYH